MDKFFRDKYVLKQKEWLEVVGGAGSGRHIEYVRSYVKYLQENRGIAPNSISPTGVLFSLKRKERLPNISKGNIAYIFHVLKNEGLLEGLSDKEEILEIRKRAVSKTPKRERKKYASNAGKAYWAQFTKKERSQIAKEREATKPFEVKSRISKKYGKAGAKVLAEKYTHEERSAFSKKAQDTRGRKIADEELKNVPYMKLPTLHLLSKREENKLIKYYHDYFFFHRARSKGNLLNTFPIIWFSARNDYEEIKQEFRIAIYDALRRWDKKRNLDKLVSESVIYHLYRYFGGRKRYLTLMAEIGIRCLLEQDQLSPDAISPSLVFEELRDLVEGLTTSVLNSAIQRLRGERVIKKLSSEHHSKLRTQVWEKITRYEELRYIEKLPILGSLSGEETIDYISYYMEKYQRQKVTSDKTNISIRGLETFAPEYRDDLESEFRIAIIEALVRWDKKQSLDTLVADSIIFHVSNKLRSERRYQKILTGAELEFAERLKTKTELREGYYAT